MNRVVVTGIGAVTPIGNDAQTTWKGMKSGKNGIGFITRFDTEEFKVKVAAEVKNFDPTLYLEKKEIRKTDLYTQYALAAASQAVEDSGIIGTVEPERLGVYVGSGIGGMTTFVENCKKLFDGGPKKVSPFFIPSMIANIAAGTIAIKHNAQGPSMCVVTACATSTHTIGEAFHAIRYGYADAMIAGGAEATLNELAIAGFTSCMALSTINDPQRASIPFDKRRDGFVLGEGSGILILEEYEHAKARNAKIYAEIVGYGNTDDAYHITAPHPEGKGASTELNDKGETMAVKKALGDKAYDIYISSTKSMTGHMLGAAGAVEAIASVMALKEGVIPPTIGYQEPDPECDLNYVPNQAVEAKVDFAASTSLGFGGHNGCLVFKRVEEKGE